MHARPTKQTTHTHHLLDPATLVEESLSILEPQIFIDYLNLYVAYREITRASGMGWVRSGIGNVVAAVKGEETNENKISDIISTVISDLRITKTFNQWYKLVFTIRAKADECKALKTTNELSLSWLTLHALADFIIGELYRVSNDLTEKVRELKAEIAQLEAYNDRCLEEINENNNGKQLRTGRQGKDVVENNIKIQELTKKLAMLGDAKYINKAILEKLIEDQQVTDANELKKFNAESKGNYSAPLFLQRHLCEWLYEVKFQPRTKIDFNRFIETSLKKGLLRNQEELIEQQAASKERLKVAKAYVEKEEAQKKMSSSQPKLDVDDEILKTLSSQSSDETKIVVKDDHSSESSMSEEEAVDEAVEKETITNEIELATTSPSVYGQGNLTLYAVGRQILPSTGDVNLSTQVEVPTSPKHTT